MEIAKLKGIMHDSEYYTKSFHAFAKKSNKFDSLSNWGDTVFPKLVLDRLVKSFPADTEMKLLGVGSGSGEMDSKMAASIRSRFKSVRNVVLEPAAKQLEMYRSLIERKKSDNEFRGIEFDLRQIGIEEYRSKEGDHPTKYHFISAIHSLYYVDDFKDTIRYLYDCLEEGGILLLIVSSVDGGVDRFVDRFTTFQNTVIRYLCTTHLRDVLSSFNIPFDESKQSSRVDITTCFEQGSEDRELIIDFLSHTLDLRGSAPPELYKEVVDYIGSDQCSERMEDGTVLFNNDWDAAIAQKPLSQ